MSLGELATALGLELGGDPDRQISRLAAIGSAGDDELSFVIDARYAAALSASAAGAVIVPPALAARAPGCYLISENPYASYARASWLLTPDPATVPGIHPQAVVHSDARVADSASIGAFVDIGAGAVIGERAVIGAHTSVGAASVIGARCRLFPRVTVYSGVTLGADCRVQSGAVLGSEGFGFAWSDGWLPIHQTGGLSIGERVFIGSNTTIDCGAIGPTVIGDGVILDNQIQIAHNVRIGENTAMAGCVGVAGSTVIGSHCQIGGACNIVGHLSICDRVTLSAASLVTRSITEPGRYSSGMPLQGSRSWGRTFVAIARLDELFKRVRRLERGGSGQLEQSGATGDQDGEHGNH